MGPAKGDFSSEALQLIEDCETREDRLTDWERSFLDSLGVQLAKGYILSDKQQTRLDEIWERVTKKG